jgi:hypothetical protein
MRTLPRPSTVGCRAPETQQNCAAVWRNLVCIGSWTAVPRVTVAARRTVGMGSAAIMEFVDSICR